MTTKMMIEGDCDICEVDVGQLKRVRIGGLEDTVLFVSNGKETQSVTFETAAKCKRAYNRVTDAWKNLQASKQKNNHATH